MERKVLQIRRSGSEPEPEPEIEGAEIVVFDEVAADEIVDLIFEADLVIVD